ncbi:unnamed protein product [Mytilus edulis]|uniref:Uncharacterized protein n=1 Tax=Mytilus edulis TaxID=6550 RepID=A0A8S3RBQ7_MYTED|nr:unnamed protein product [Mytilus edulis]
MDINESGVLSHTISILGGHPMNQQCVIRLSVGGHPMNQECVKSDYQYISWTSMNQECVKSDYQLSVYGHNESGGHPNESGGVLSQTISILGGHPMNQESVLSQTISILGGHPMNQECVKSYYQYIRWTSNESGAIGRLGGQQMKEECDNLKVKILDQTNQEIMMDIKRSKDEMLEMKKSVKSLNNSVKSLKRTKKAMTVEVKRLKISHEDTVPWNIRVKRICR